jgi:hypothetical protein
MSRPSLGRDITVVLACKLVALTLLWLAFFSPSHQPSASVATHLFGAAATPTSERR